MQNINDKTTLCKVEHNLSDYVIDMYSRFFDLTEGRYLALSMLLERLHAGFIDVEEFRSVFSMEGTGFFSILEYITQIDNQEKLKQYGEMCYQEAMQQQEETVRLQKIHS